MVKFFEQFEVRITYRDQEPSLIDNYLTNGGKSIPIVIFLDEDFNEITQENQQSSRADKISMQQAGVLGRIILAWQNTPMQMTRLTKKAMSDLINRRGSDKANISRIIYLGVSLDLETIPKNQLWVSKLIF